MKGIIALFIIRFGTIHIGLIRCGVIIHGMREQGSVLASGLFGIVDGAGTHGAATVVLAVGIIPSMPVAGMAFVMADSGMVIMEALAVKADMAVMEVGMARAEAALVTG